MKIWIINHYAGSLEYGMEFRHFYFAKNLIEYGHEVKIIAASYSHLRKYNPQFEGKYKTENNGGVDFVFIPTRNYSGNGKARALSMIDFYKNTISVCKNFEKPDVIYASSPHPFGCLAAIKLANHFKCKCVSEVRDLWPEALVYYKGLSSSSALVKGLEIIEHKMYKNSDALIFTKPGDVDYLKEKKWLKSCGGNVEDKKCHYINNGVDYDTYVKQIKENQYDGFSEDGNFNVVYIGTIREVNNLDIMLDAAKILQSDSKIRFKIFGDGEDLPKLRARCENEQIGNVDFYGFVEKKFIPNILSHSSVNILNYSPTMYNWTRGNSSNKLFEYMASGKPIISTVKMGYSPIIGYSCGLEIENCNGQALSEKIVQIKNMEQSEYKQMSENAAAAAQEFDYHVLSQKLNDLLTSVAKEKQNG